MLESTNETPEVPQWCVNAAKEWFQSPFKSPADFASQRERELAAIFAKHASGVANDAEARWVAASDHDRVVREKDATIADLERKLATACNSMYVNMQAACKLPERDAEIAELRATVADLKRRNATAHDLLAAAVDEYGMADSDLMSFATGWIHSTKEHLAASDATIAELRAQQLTLARDYDPNCDEFDFAYQREVMKSASRIIDAAQGLAQSLGRDPEGCLVTACECAVEVIDECDILKEELKELRTRAETAEAKCAEYRNTFTAANEMRLSEVRLRHQVQQRADALTAQLAAANDSLRAVEGESDR